LAAISLKVLRRVLSRQSKTPKPSRSSSGDTKLADKTSEDPTKISGLLSILEKSVEIHVALIMYCFLLFFDICLELFEHSGVYDLAFGEPNVRITAVLAIKLVVIFVIFSIFISIFMPTIAVLTEQNSLLAVSGGWDNV
jgi:hypothetical protein